MNKIIIFTDGSCTLKKDSNNHGGVGVFFNNYDDMKDISKSYSGKDITNQSMELLACVTGIEKVIKHMNKKNCLWELEIYTDSMYTINCATTWASKWILLNWQRQVGKQLKSISNLKIIKKLYRLTKLYPVKYYHVRSHRKEPPKGPLWDNWYGNSKADELAGKAMRCC